MIVAMTAFFVVLLFGYVVYLHTKISDLQRRSGGGLSPEGSAPTQVSQAQTKGVYEPAVLPESSRSTQAQVREALVNQGQPVQESALWRWVATDWPLKLGALLVILGLGWFVSYAFAQNWIGPVGRITLGMVFGCLVLVGGFVRAKREEHQGTIIMGLGAAALLITIYAAREVYDFFTPLSALLLMASVAGFIAFSSVRDGVKSRALLGLLVGCIAPFLTVSADPSVSGLFVYLFVLIAASIWIVTITGWKELLVASAAIYAIFSIGNILNYIPQSEEPTLLVLITAFVIMFYGVGVISALKSKSVERADVFIKILSALIFVFWVKELVVPHMQSIVMILASGLTALAAWGLQLQTANRWLVVLHGALSLVYLAIAISFELEGATALLAYIALTAVGAWLAGAISHNYKTGQFFGAPFIVLFFAALSEVSYYALWSEIIVSGVLAAVVAALGFFWYSKHSALEEGYVLPIPELTITYLYGALLTGVLFLWMFFEKVVPYTDTAHGIALVTYALVGVGMYGYGQLNGYPKTKIAGGVLLGAVIARLLLVEVWNMILAARVIVFILIGGLLMGVAFLKPREKGV